MILGKYLIKITYSYVKKNFKFDTNGSSNNLALRIIKNIAKIIKLGAIMCRAGLKPIHALSTGQS